MSRKVPKIRTASRHEGPAPNTFHEENPSDNPALRLFVKNGFHAVRCNGEAHSNPHIDGCLECLNHTWGWVAEKNCAECWNGLGPGPCEACGRTNEDNHGSKEVPCVGPCGSLSAKHQRLCK